VSAESLPQYLSAVRIVAKSFLDGQGALTAGDMPILQAFLRAYGQWDARSFPRLTHRGGVFRLGVDTALAPFSHSLTWVNVDISMRRHRVQ
jgi:hypothetical protein